MAADGADDDDDSFWGHFNSKCLSIDYVSSFREFCADDVKILLGLIGVIGKLLLLLLLLLWLLLVDILVSCWCNRANLGDVAGVSRIVPRLSYLPFNDDVDAVDSGDDDDEGDDDDATMLADATRRGNLFATILKPI